MRLVKSTLVLMLVRGLVLVDLGRLGKNYNKMVPSWLEKSGGRESGKQLRWSNRSKNFFYCSWSNK